MEPPTARELHLETLLRQQDSQLSDLTNELSRLRQYLSKQPGPSTADPVTLPPALVSVLLPHINNATNEPTLASSSTTVTAALIQRATLLQQENDELHEILKSSETGKLKEEVIGLRRVVERMEGALKESHQVITNLSTELEKSYDSFDVANRQNSLKSHSHLSRNPRLSPPSSHRSSSRPTSNANGTPNLKAPPTGPRAHKKPRLSEPLAQSPPHDTALLPGIKREISNSRHSRGERAVHSRDSPSHSPDDHRGGKVNYTHSKIALDEDPRKRPRSPNMEREMERETRVRDRERAADRERERDRDRDRDRAPRRNGNHSTLNDRSGSSGRRVGRGGAPGAGRSGYGGGDRDRTLAERMGL